MARLKKKDVLEMAIEEINVEFANLGQGGNLDCTNCTTCVDCFQCSDCVECSDCNYCDVCTNCKNCQHCRDCNACEGCNFCFMCDGLKNKTHYILNVKLTKEEYDQKMTELGF